MMPFLRQIFLFLVALAALAIVLMMIKTTDAAELKQSSDGTRQIVVEATTQDKGAAATDLTAESGAAPADTLASEEPAPQASKPEAGTDETELTDREALALAQGDEEAFIAGGAELYAQTMDRLNRLYLTRIERDFPGDTYFPEVDLSGWRLLEQEHHPASTPEALPYAFLTYER